MHELIKRMKSLLPGQKKLEKASSGRFQRVGTVLRNKDGLEAFEIAIGVGIAVVLGVIVLSNNKDLFNNTIWPKVVSNATSIFS